MCRHRSIDFEYRKITGDIDMPRPHPIRVTDLPYHIIARTNKQEAFPLELRLIWKIYEEELFFIHHAYGVQIHSFVLMNNHFHLILSDPRGTIDLAMRWLMTQSSKRINKQAGTKNHLYGQRHYRSLIPNYHYYMHAYKYVYRNPVEAGACEKVEEYEFSTLRGLLGLQKLNIPLFGDELFNDFEGNLRWLNMAGYKERRLAIKAALNRTVFTLPKTSSRRLSALENERY
jgi:putative transposase